MAQSTEDISNPFFARLYDRVLRRGTEPERVLRCRRAVVDGLRGRVVEVGPGNGPNFALYPDDVEEVIAVEPEPYLRERADRVARRVSAPIRVERGAAERLPVEDASVDAVVLALVLCSVADQSVALAEARRVLRPGGQLRVYEHVVAEHPLASASQRFAQATFWPRAFGNCHPARDTRGAIAAAGFDVSQLKRFVLHPGGVQPPMPHILGTAPML